MAYTTVTLANMIEEARSRVNNQKFYSDDELTAYINESLCMWQLMTGYWRSTVTLATEGAKIYYDVSSHMLKPLRVEYDGTPLPKDNFFSMDWCKGLWEFAPAATPDRWFPVALNYLGLYPAPGAGHSLRIDGLSHAPVMNAPTDFVDINRWIFDALVDYVQHVCAFKTSGEEFKATSRLYKSFVDAAATQNVKLKNTSIYRKTIGENLDGLYHPTNRSGQKRTR